MTAIFTLPDLVIWGGIVTALVWEHRRLKRLERENDK